MILIYCTSAVLCAIAALHVYWAFGGKLFTGAVIPTKDNGERLFQPGIIATLAVAAFLCAGAIVLIRHNTSPSKLTVSLTIFYAAVFFIRGIGDFRYVGISKRVRETDFGLLDTFIFTPLVFILSFIFIFSLTV